MFLPKKVNIYGIINISLADDKFEHTFLDAISISTVGCVTQVTSQAISDLERV